MRRKVAGGNTTPRRHDPFSYGNPMNYRKTRSKLKEHKYDFSHDYPRYFIVAPVKPYMRDDTAKNIAKEFLRDRHKKNMEKNQ